jgi:hypothetical protein
MATKHKRPKQRRPRIYTQARCERGCAVFLLAGTKGQLVAEGVWQRGCRYCRQPLVKIGEIRE